MSEHTINVLQIGTSDWQKNYDIPNNLAWQMIEPSHLEYAEILQLEENQEYSLVIITDLKSLKSIGHLEDHMQPYKVIYNQKLQINNQDMLVSLEKNCAFAVDMSDPQALLQKISLSFFDGQSGIKLGINTIEIIPSFHGEISYQGNTKIELTGKFGPSFRSIATWRSNMFSDPGRRLELALEFQKSPGIELELIIYESAIGSSEIKKDRWILNEQQLKQPSIIEGVHSDGSGSNLSAVLYAKGSGTLSLGSLHYRWSRFQFGKSILGGKLYCDSQNDEFYYYYDPGDLKPPLNVYFSGYRSLEGFEGYPMMKSTHTPFLLFSDPRLEGGAFYRGSQEFEHKFVEIIQRTLQRLGFNSNELIMSGISMGTFGALYYGAKLQPHAIILGKPLINLGTIAINGRLQRPQEFDTALDLLLKETGENSYDSGLKFDASIWDAIMSGEFKNTTVAVAYMKNDDYDRKAFGEIRDNFKHLDTHVIGKGWLGRHNDNSRAVVNWFLTQYRYFLINDFGRLNNEQ